MAITGIGGDFVISDYEGIPELQCWVNTGGQQEKRPDAAMRIEACIRDNRTELDLTGLYLDSLPDVFDKLPQLTILQINDNRIKEFPESLYSLQNLKGLYVIGNAFKKIPTQIMNLISLESISFMDNMLEEIPQELSLLPNLECIDFCSNPSISEIPDCLKNLRLKLLDLENCGLTAFPSWLFEVESLKRLTIYGNPILEVPDAVFQAWQKGTVINIQEVQLTNEQVMDIRTKIENPSYSGPSFQIQASKFNEPQSSKRVFHLVDPGSDRFQDLTEIFNRILVPLYGPQDDALAKIALGQDRVAYLLYEGENAVAVLVFKTILSNEFADKGALNSVEIKSLFVDHSAENSGRGLGSALINYLFQEVHALGLKQDGIHVTVSETKKDSLAFFQKKGFQIIYEMQGEYIDGVTEYLLYMPTPDGRISQKSSSYKVLRTGDDFETPSVIVHSAHRNRFHSMVNVQDGRFVSGSADNCVTLWDEFGAKVEEIVDVELSLESDRSWVTAMAANEHGYVAVGRRDGTIELFKDGFSRQVLAKQPNTPHVSLPENQKRVTCLAFSPDGSEPTLTIGYPTIFSEYSFMQSRTTSVGQSSKNDWVYAIEYVNPKTLLAVTGCVVDLWRKVGDEWIKREELISEPKLKKRRGKKRQRPFISALGNIGDGSYATTDFKGSVKVFDLTEQQVTHDWNAHVGRIWDVAMIEEGYFVTGGDDALLKFWDVRSPDMIREIPSGNGPIHSLLKIGPNKLAAGVGDTDEGLTSDVQLRIYDLNI